MITSDKPLVAKIDLSLKAASFQTDLGPSDELKLSIPFPMGGTGDQIATRIEGEIGQLKIQS